jgi:hypothetical protein
MAGLGFFRGELDELDLRRAEPLRLGREPPHYPASVEDFDKPIVGGAVVSDGPWLNRATTAVTGTGTWTSWPSRRLTSATHRRGR